MAKYHVTFEGKPGKLVPLAFNSEAARAAFMRSNPGKTTMLTARAAPKRTVASRTASQIGSAS